MTHLNAAATPPIQEPALRYLHQLFVGHVLQAMNKPDEAMTAYKNAGAIAPTAQSARVSLMNLLMLRGDTAAAEALAQQVQTESGAEMDPWWMYWQGQYRLHPAAMARVRELSK
jgi:Tfp pilus assembly protein PilF